MIPYMNLNEQVDADFTRASTRRQRPGQLREKKTKQGATKLIKSAEYKTTRLKMLGDPFKTERSGTSGETIITIHSALENLSAEWFAK